MDQPEVVLPRDAALALFALYDVVWNRIVFLDSEDLRYSSIERTDQDVLDETVELVSRYEEVIRKALI